MAFDTEPRRWFNHWARSGIFHEPVETVTLVASAAVRGDASLDLEVPLRMMDALASNAPGTATELVRYLAQSHGFGTHSVDYDDPLSSYIDSTLRTQVGLPLSLSIVAIGVAARVGVVMTGVGLPGHFIVRDQTEGTLIDPFHGGRILDVDDCEAMFTSIYGQHAVWDPARHLVEANTQVIVERMLTNLRYAGATKNFPEVTYRAATLQMSLPGSDHRLALTTAPALADIGRLDLAADLLEQAAEIVDANLANSSPDVAASELRSRAQMLRARLN